MIMSTKLTAQEIAANTVLTITFLILFGVAIYSAVTPDASDLQRPCVTEDSQY